MTTHDNLTAGRARAAEAAWGKPAYSVVRRFPALCHDCREPLKRDDGGRWRHARISAKASCSYASFNAPRPMQPSRNGPIPPMAGEPLYSVVRRPTMTSCAELVGMGDEPIRRAALFAYATWVAGLSSRDEFDHRIAELVEAAK